MSILIDREKCIGCGSCREVCPGTLIKLDDEGKAYIKCRSLERTDALLRPRNCATSTTRTA